ncbi:SRPBCC domain-containing protein [Nibribacter ruber]|uniref:SRPBCC domain-containing protein n=1 Tax=Nibribacter ruber TaxID=2698458 RepID=A0A6P1NUI8_9BACT|nr:SRPBCC domain-containing protein [Nibribacter ruber]QHL86710.1 SRPBCC domain-containing protein [Nibribacter ruber]
MATHPNFVISREINAPIERVWQAWTQEENLKQWWSPAGFDLEVKEFNAVPNGTFLYGMSAEGMPTMWGKCTYVSLEAPRRLEYIDAFTDEEGNLESAPFSEAWPTEMLNVLTLQEQNGKTLITLTGKPVNATPQEEQTYFEGHSDMQQSYSGIFQQLAAFLQ